jgi:hypothetical protein
VIAFGKLCKASELSQEQIDQTLKRMIDNNLPQAQSNKKIRINLPIMQNNNIDLDDPAVSFRRNTCQTLDNELRRLRVNLLRAPPCSGKTSLATCFRKFYQEHPHDEDGTFREIISITLLSYSGDFDQLFKEYNMNFEEAFTAPSKGTRRLVIVDEIQIAYCWERKHDFWPKIKKLLANTEVKNLSVLLLGAYGYSKTIAGEYFATPVDFPFAFDLGTLRLKDEEWKEILDSYHQTVAGNYIKISANVSDRIKQATKLHAGLARRCLWYLNEKFFDRAKAGEPISDDSLLAALISPGLIYAISDSRCLQHKRENLNPQQLKLLDQIIADKKIVATNAIDADVLRPLIVGGTLVLLKKRSTDRLAFSAPIIRMAYISNAYGRTLQDSLQPRNLPETVIEAIKRMNPNYLKNSLSLGEKNRLVERQWQNEFYRALCSMLSINDYVSPDVGQVFGSKGAIDFYINGNKKWAVELLREGDRMDEHEERFLSGGVYASMKREINDWLIVDFRREDKKIRGPIRNNFMHVLYSADYSKAKICRKDQEVLTIITSDLSI